ncbi:MAG TPA: pyridine nucleotide-disulfide oxidoreductase [Verrucomicrobiales bacterium]|nr:pyridine nucleotide-disulfide oxidoreductase [Verrucomicrobiales bacterium]
MADTHHPYEHDLAVIGGGSGGYAAARTAHGAGLKVAVVEGGAEVGGLCILRGCMPTKALLYAAEIAHLARNAGTWGIRTGEVAVDFPAVMARKRRLIQEFANHRRGQLNDGRFHMVRAEARFRDAHTLDLSNGRTMTARHFVICTGSVVAEPPLPSLKEVGCLTSDSALELDKLPESLIVLGGGPIAIESAQFFARMGTRVTVIQRGGHLLRDLDEDAAVALETAFKEEGIHLHTGTRLIEARKHRNHKTVVFEKDGLRTDASAEEILFALGRTPNTKSLHLERAGVELDGRRIVTNDRMQTSVPHIFAAGDCTGPHEIVHIAIQQGEIAAHNIAHPEELRTMDYRQLVSVVFSDPQVGTVGLTEQEARKRGIDYLTASYPFNDHGKSLIMEALHGFVKLLADPKSGEILGGCCVGPVGGELIHEIIVAMTRRMTVHELAATPHYHPTLAEIWTYPAEELAGQITVSASREAA